MNIDNFIVGKDATILQTMNLINKNGMGIVYICQNYTLIGVVTDGDIRRYLLKNGDINNNINSIVNNDPMTLNDGSAINSHEYMKKNKIKSVPIINHNRQILYIDFLNDKRVYKHNDIDIPVVIMAGGKGTRLHPYTQILPKPLIPIGEKTITERIVDSFKAFGCKQFFMIVNYKKEFIKAFFVDKKDEYAIDFIEETQFMGTGGGIKLAENKIDSDFILSNCDILLDTDISAIYHKHIDENNFITIIGVEKKNVIPYGVLEFKNKNLKIIEKPEFSYVINSGVYILNKDIFDYIENKTFIHITDVIQNCMAMGKKIGMYTINDNSWMDMGQMDELEKMREHFSNV